jgi:mRNA interferase RelE/StbE
VKVGFRASFARDIEGIREKDVLARVREILQEVESALTLKEIPNLKKLGVRGSYWRIRIGDYRIGLVLDGNVLVFVRCLHRREIYRYFP